MRLSMEEKFMKIALQQAQKAYDIGEVPVGAVIVRDGQVISKAYNLKEKTNNPCGHAEIRAINKACKKLDTWRLEDCEMFITLEPCLMCVGAIIHSRIKKIYIGTLDTKTGAVISRINALDTYVVNHKVDYEKGVLEKECSEILKRFFKNLRLRKGDKE